MRPTQRADPPDRRSRAQGIATHTHTDMTRARSHPRERGSASAVRAARARYGGASVAVRRAMPDAHRCGAPLAEAPAQARRGARRDVRRHTAARSAVASRSPWRSMSEATATAPKAMLRTTHSRSGAPVRQASWAAAPPRRVRRARCAERQERCAGGVASTRAGGIYARANAPATSSRISASPLNMPRLLRLARHDGRARGRAAHQPRVEVARVRRGSRRPPRGRS